MTDIAKAKQEVRAKVSAAVAAMSPKDRATESDDAIALGLHWNPLKNATTIMVYAPSEFEVHTAGLGVFGLRNGARLCIPEVNWKDGTMRPVELKTWDVPTWKIGAGGIPQIPPGLRFVNPAEIDMIFVPGIVFDPNGNRLGRGKGFYDRFLSNPAITAICVGLAFSEQMVDDVPREEGDVPMHAMCTADGIFVCPRGVRAGLGVPPSRGSASDVRGDWN